MRYFILVQTLALIVTTVSAGGHRSIAWTHARHRRDHVPRAANTSFVIKDKYQGQDIFNQFDFFTAPDPTQGTVNFLSQQDAMSKGLAYVQGDNITVLAVDDYTPLATGQNRNSVRISSKKTYSGGLFIADFAAMPTGCGTWPAWWSVGPDWPNGGEIDVVEGVNGNGTNHMTLHTGQAGNCTLSTSAQSQTPASFTGSVLGTTCISANGANDGCGIADPDGRSFAGGFNSVGGGVFVHLWDQAGIKIWHFARADIPQDITAQQPNPASWPTPQAFFDASTCSTNANFHDHVLVIDTTLCGGLGNALYPSSGCPGTCADAVADPNNFHDAKWKVNYIAVYNSVILLN